MLLRRQALQTAPALLGAIAVSMATVPAYAQGETRAERLGLKGYDPVAYFTLSTPTPGVAQYEYVYDGSRYRFANARHLAMFKANPEKYAPQFGGLCANNMSNCVRRESDPAIWIIANDRLWTATHLHVHVDRIGAYTHARPLAPGQARGGHAVSPVIGTLSPAAQKVKELHDSLKFHPAIGALAAPPPAGR